MKTVIEQIARFVFGLKRPTRADNERGLRERGETLASFAVREAIANDMAALVDLHVETWNATYPLVSSRPTHAIRDRQWREAFGSMDGSWFCFVVQRSDGRLAGFAKGTLSDHPEFAGQLSKIYLLSEYQRVGLGRLLVGHVARRFLGQGISSMILFAEPHNPSCAFFESLGAERVLDNAGRFHGAYGWRDLNDLTARCPID